MKKGIEIENHWLTNLFFADDPSNCNKQRSRHRLDDSKINRRVWNRGTYQLKENWIPENKRKSRDHQLSL